MVGKEGLANKVVFQQRPKRSDGMSHVGNWGKRCVILESWSAKCGQ